MQKFYTKYSIVCIFVLEVFQIDSFIGIKIKEGKKDGRKKGKPNFFFFFFRTLIFFVTAVVENLASWNCIYDDNRELYLSPMLL